jgi:hypothetical protein
MSRPIHYTAARSTADPGRADAVAAGGPLLRVTRLGVLVLLVLALVNGLFLYLVPGRAEVDYAWPIAPPINAAMIGAGYLAGVVATGLVVLYAHSWRSLRVLPLALAVLSATSLAATLIHRDRFFWDYAPTWVWTAIYATVPLFVLGFWVVQERASGPAPAADPRLDRLRARSAVLGAVLTSIGVALFVAPTAMADVWPWPLTPLLARVGAAWYLLAATVLLVSARTLRRCHEVPIAYATLGTWSVLLLVLPAVYSEDLADRPGSLVAWMVVQVALLALAASALARTLPVLRAGEERL